ncbi:12806_t:CDS:2 [Acaulospora morrowiae]|uniref:12806_t:CDS:1 n=1 Tax=Acaulospora morrowiae TaxID=94023 RepID=A0A9N9D1U0_9GLOM|nr:12806_t:CDS:2 [Acaulospora morrowiae]
MANNQNPNIGLNNVANNLNQLVQQLMANANQPQEVEQAFKANRVPDARKIPIIVSHLKGSAATWWINRRVQNPAVNRWDDPMAQPLSFKSNFLKQFRIVSLKEKWFSQLTQRKQGPTETVEQFYLIIEDLFRKVITGENYFPEMAKAHIFLNGLRPELNRAEQKEISKDKSFEMQRKGTYEFQSIPTERKKPKRTTTRKRNIEDELPAIASLVTPYSIVSNLQNKPVNITFGQLLKEILSMRQKLSKSLTKKRTVRRKTKRNVNVGTSQESTALYCIATVYEHKISLIIDSGLFESVVTIQLLKKLKVKPERSSIIKMISVHGESKRALDKISNLPFNVGGNEIPVDIVITDTNFYQALVGNNWLSKVNALIDYNGSQMSIFWNNKKIKIPDQSSNFEENYSMSSLNEKQLSDSIKNNSIFSFDETIIHIENQSSSSLKNQITSLNELIVNENQTEYTFNSLKNQLNQTYNENKEPSECYYNSVENYLTIYFDEIENNEANKTQIENLDKKNLKDSTQIIKFDKETSI